MSELMIREELKEVDESKAAQIEAVFAPMVDMLKSFEGQYDEVMALEQTPEKGAKAKRLRLDIAKIRVQADKARKAQKEQYLRAGNAIQAVYNILKFAVEDKEKELKGVEEYYERIESEKAKARQKERAAELEKYEVDGSVMDLGNMNDSVWENFLVGTKTNYESMKAAEAKAEQDRIEAEKKEAEERARIEAENKQLKIDAKKAEKKRLAEQKKIDAERQAQDDKLRKEREAREAVEREAKEKEAERLRSEKEVLAAPDKEKLNGWANALLAKVNTLQTEEARKTVNGACQLMMNLADRL